jgi:GNAT superfamily N-acetyltransferase
MERRRAHWNEHESSGGIGEVDRVGSILPPAPIPRSTIQPPEPPKSVTYAIAPRQTEPPPVRRSVAPSRLPSALPPPLEDEDTLKELLSAPPASEGGPSSFWRLKQKYPSYIPLEEQSPESSPGTAFAIKVLDSSEELISSYRLRHRVYDALGYLQQPSCAGLEIDEYDKYAIPFGVIAIHTGELVGTLRLITNHVQEVYWERIQRFLDVTKDLALYARVMRARKRPLPSMISDLVEAQIKAFNTDDQEVEEGSRTVIHPSYRRGGLLRGLMEFFLAYALAKGDPVLIAGCVPEHVPVYGRYGFQKLPGTELAHFDTVGQIANTIICNTRSLPEPTNSHVQTLLEAMLAGEPECILEEHVHDIDHENKSIWHLAESAQELSTKSFNHGGASYAVG